MGRTLTSATGEKVAGPNAVVSFLLDGPSFCSPNFSIFEPWDLLRGKDVFVSPDSLQTDIDAADLSHFAPNCATFSRAREIPIHGVSNAPRPIRSTEFPTGIPDELSRMNRKQKTRLELDTKMAELSAESCLRKQQGGKYFSLEHPANSIAWSLDSWRNLARQEGVERYLYSTCMFEGSKRRKMQALLTNHHGVGRRIARICLGTRVCDRTGEPHLRWRPRVQNGKILQFSTGEEREYPPGFCDTYAKGLHDNEMVVKSFVEIFSGPNAPLSHAVGRVVGAEVPGNVLTHRGSKGVVNELQELRQLGVRSATQNDGAPSAEVPVHVFPETQENRKIALESGRQPSYGKRVQLIPDGIQNPEEHLQWAKLLDHPFNLEVALKEDHKVVLEKLSGNKGIDDKRRLETLEKWKSLACSQDILNEQAKDEKRASVSAKKLGRKPRTALMRRLGDLYAIEDKAVSELCLYGMPIVGDALCSPFFEPYRVDGSVSLKELLSLAPGMQSKMISRVERMASNEPREQNEAIWQKTLKEARQGSMQGPLTDETIQGMHGKYFNVVPSFGLAQGCDEKGTKKFRRIDDHSACLNNAAGNRMQKIQMANVDYIVIMIKHLFQKFGTTLQVSTQDMQAAYRQIPVNDSQLRLTVTAVFDPYESKAKLFQLYGQPFGAAHAVPNFYRVAEFLSRLLIRGFNLFLDHFFDDFFLVTRSHESEVAAFCMSEGFKLLGFTLDPDKNQVPSSVAAVLGVVINTSVLHQERVLSVEPKPTRRQNLVTIIDKVIQDDYLAPSLAASLVGKFGFLCSTLFGKLGRCCTASIRARQYSTNLDCTLSPDIKISLSLMKFFVLQAPQRQLDFSGKTPPLILYTDASDVPERVNTRWVLGAVLLVQHPTEEMFYTSWVVPKSVIEKWVPRANYMGQLEILAAPLALKTWMKYFQRAQVLHFIDNDSAASGLVKGYSPKQDSSSLIGSYWIAAAAAQCEVYIERVESKSNIADGPSRLSFTEVLQAGAVYTPPCTDFLGSALSEFHDNFEMEFALKPSHLQSHGSTKQRDRDPPTSTGIRVT